jgi:multidrug efflux pump subunit AcrB
MILLQMIIGTTAGRIAAAAVLGFVALKAWSMNQQSTGAAKERERAAIAGAANVQKAEKARAAVRSAESKRPAGVRDPDRRD